MVYLECEILGEFMELQPQLIFELRFDDQIMLWTEWFLTPDPCSSYIPMCPQTVVRDISTILLNEFLWPWVDSLNALNWHNHLWWIFTELTSRCLDGTCQCPELSCIQIDLDTPFNNKGCISLIHKRWNMAEPGTLTLNHPV